MPTVSGFSVNVADRVRETTSTTGTGTYSLNGAVTGFQSFVAGIGSGNRTLYTSLLGTSWEVGIGTVTSGAPATLSRDVILASSNSNNAVSWGAGTKDIFTTAAAALLTQIYQTPFASIKVTTFTSSGTFTTDAKNLYAIVRMVGGGGAGGGTAATGTGAEGSGGGAGEYAEGLFTAAQLGASKTVTIGAAGTPGAAGNNAGGNGGTTSLGTLLTAVGGTGGPGSATTAGDLSNGAGAGGTGGTGGYLRFQGGDGGRGIVRSGIPILNGVGGASHMSGSQGQAIASETAGREYGGGGPGAAASASLPARQGGAGAKGVLIVTEYLKP